MDAGSSWDNSSSISYTQMQPHPRSSHDLKWYQQKNGGTRLIKLPPPPQCSAVFQLFYIFCQTRSQYKTTQATDCKGFECVCWWWGGVPHFLNICISSSPFVLLLKAALAPIRRDVAAQPGLWGPHTSTRLFQLSRNKQPDWHILSKHHKTDAISWFTCFYWRGG